MKDWNTNESFSDKEVKHLAEQGQIWRERFFWNGKLEKVGNAGMYLCYCIDGCGTVVGFNRWTPKFNTCIKCHIKKAA